MSPLDPYSYLFFVCEGKNEEAIIKCLADVNANIKVSHLGLKRSCKSEPLWSKFPYTRISNLILRGLMLGLSSL